MSVVPFPPKDEPGEGLALSVAEAKEALALAASAPGMRREPYRMVLVGLSATLDALMAGAEAVRRPADAELRRDIIAVYERQARAAQQQASLLGTAHSRRAAAVSGAVVAVLVLAAGGGAYALGYARGGADAINQACAADAVKEQDGGKVCSFWLTSPTRTGQRKG